MCNNYYKCLISGSYLLNQITVCPCNKSHAVLFLQLASQLAREIQLGCSIRTRNELPYIGNYSVRENTLFHMLLLTVGKESEEFWTVCHSLAMQLHNHYTLDITGLFFPVIMPKTPQFLLQGMSKQTEGASSLTARVQLTLHKYCILSTYTTDPPCLQADLLYSHAQINHKLQVRVLCTYNTIQVYSVQPGIITLEPL